MVSEFSGFGFRVTGFRRLELLGGGIGHLDFPLKKHSLGEFVRHQVEALFHALADKASAMRRANFKPSNLDVCWNGEGDMGEDYFWKGDLFL